MWLVSASPNRLLECDSTNGLALAMFSCLPSFSNVLNTHIDHGDVYQRSDTTAFGYD